MRHALIFLILSIHALIGMKAIGQELCKLEGKVVNQAGEPIPYAGIYVHGIGKGGMANVQGEFSLQLPCSAYQISFQSLGYQTKKASIKVGKNNQSSRIELAKISYPIKEVNIDPDSEDPAYNIIRKATVMAEFYKKQINAYTTHLYIRSFYDVKDIPWIAEKFIPEEELKNVKTGNINETLLEYSFEKPNTVKERIIARKTGDRDSSKSSSNYVNLNFYNLGGAEIINPLSRGAFSVYEFEHINTYFDGSQKVHKIKIIPKRRGNDLMKGFIHINDGIWNINAVDVEFTQTGGTFYYIQFYQEIEELVWMPINHKIKIDFSLMGFEGKVQYLATLSDVKVKTDQDIDRKIRNNLNSYAPPPDVKDSIQLKKQTKKKKVSKTQEKINELIQKEKLSNRETFKLVRLIKKQSRKEAEEDSAQSLEIKRNFSLTYEDSALSMPDSVWNKRREVPLSNEENSIYQARDSLNKVEKGDTIYNKKRSSIGKILFFDGGIRGTNKNTTFYPKGLLSGIDGTFNTVDGFKIRKTLFKFRASDRKGKFLELTPELSYAFSRKKLLGKVNFQAQYNKKKRAGLELSLGRATSDFNQYQSMHPTLNAIASLVFTENFPKFFQEDFLSIKHHIDLSNGLVFNTSFHYSDRSLLSNNSSYKLIDFRDRSYRSNMPVNQELTNNPDLLSNHKSSRIEAGLSYTPKQFYRMRQTQKVMLHSKYPTFKVNYKQAIDGLFGSDADFQFLSFSVQQSFSYRLINKISYHFEAGRFLNNEQVFFPDFKNFNTAPFYLQTNTGSDGFSLLNYYRYNTRDEYAQAHFSVEDNHILLKYLPLLNRTNLTEELHINFLYNDLISDYYELGYSRKRIDLMINLGIYSAFNGSKFDQIGFRIGFEIPE